MPKLTLHSLNVRAVNVPLSPPIETAGGTINSAPLVLIDLLTNEGITGRTYLFCYTPLALAPLAHLVTNLEPVLKTGAIAPLSIQHTLRQQFRLLGAEGLTGMAMAGIDMAAWDALAKAANLPLVTLLGDSRPVPAYCTLRAMQMESVVAEAQAVVEAGFRAVKLRLGHAEVQADVAVVYAVRQAVGEGVQIMVDYNQCLTVPEAVRRIGMLKSLILPGLRNQRAPKTLQAMLRYGMRLQPPFRSERTGGEPRIWQKASQQEPPITGCSMQ